MCPLRWKRAEWGTRPALVQLGSWDTERYTVYKRVHNYLYIDVQSYEQSSHMTSRDIYSMYTLTYIVFDYRSSRLASCTTKYGLGSSLNGLGIGIPWLHARFLATLSKILRYSKFNSATVAMLNQDVRWIATSFKHGCQEWPDVVPVSVSWCRECTSNRWLC